MMHKLLTIFCVLPVIRSNFIDYNYVNIQPKLTPVEIMVDITNDLAYKILSQHSISNRNNFAFSPTALTSVLIALYEGNQGEGATEIYNVLKLPWNRDILRIGYRDIHRRLRTYFFDEENPLTGLSLSKENVTIIPQYEDILKFYGYDLGADMISSSEVGDSVKNATVTTQSTTIATTSEVASTEQIELIDRASFATEGVTPTSSSSTASATTQLPSSSPSTTITAQEPTTFSSSPTLIEETTFPSTTFSSSTTTPSSTASSSPETTSEATDSSSLPTEAPSTHTASTVTNDLTTDTSTFITMNEDESTTVKALSTISPLKEISTIDPSTVIFPSKRLIRPSVNRKARREGRAKRQFPLAFDDQAAFTLAVTPIHQYPNFDFVQSDNTGEFVGFYQSKTASIKKDIQHVFYLNAHETVHANYKVYNSILRFNYIEHIRSSVLELELDTKDYDLLIMLPDYGFGLDFLLQALKLAPTLRTIRQEMKPRWVQAIVPDFKLKGNIFLTNDLQNLGILEVFEPSKADFSPMTNESDIYVKHIEQSINVHLRTRPIDQLKRNIGPFNRPIEVSVNHPFLFFIVDKELDLATMAGRVINPLNVRIN